MSSQIIYNLPPERIALEPVRPRHQSRLLVLNLTNLKLEDKKFADIGNYLRSGDVIAVNNSQVISARLYGRKETGGQVEFLLLEKKDTGLWEAMGRPAARIKEGTFIEVGPENFRRKILVKEKKERGFFLLETPEDILKAGSIPLPPYIEKRRPVNEKDSSDYQTLFAKKAGSVAAPTASLHFTEELVEELKKAGVSFAPLTLYVGPGTFMPSEKPAPELYEFSKVSAEKLSKASRVCVCGTTVMRTLETVWANNKAYREEKGQTELFIKRGHRFRSADIFLTNFHLPSTPLLELVAAYIETYKPGQGEEILLKAYAEAIRKEYRFLSYGDAMLILP